MVSGGGSSSSSKSGSKTKFPEKFLGQFFSFFPEFQGGAALTGDVKETKSSLSGGNIIPEATFVRPPADTGEKLTQQIIDAALPTIRREFDTEKSAREEALNQSGLLTSPARFIKGGPVDRLTEQYNNTVLDLASRAALEGTQFEEREAARETQFNVTQFNQRLQEILGFLGIAANAGRRAKGESSSSSGGFGIGLLDSSGG